MNFSACWIVKDEEKNLKKSIISVKGCAEELIVVDTGSTDGTVRIAEECGARVEHFKWINDFSAAKNYALSLVKGEFVIFLDADEYFDPGLTAKDADIFIKLFEDAQLCGFGFMSLEVDKETNVCRDTSLRLRVLRRNAIRFENKIHETLTRIDGTEPKWRLLEQYALIHTGYSDAVVMEKFRRNIEILEAERKNLNDPLKLYHNAMYLMRDSFYYEDYDKAAEYLTYLLEKHELHMKAYDLSHDAYLRHLYNAVHVSEARRGKFSRKEIYDKVFRGMKELYADEWDALPVELHYQLRFDYRDDRFLRELDDIAPSLARAFSLNLPDRRLIESSIFGQAAEACHMRGDRRKTCLYAYRALECMPVIEGRPLLLLLYSLKDHKLRDAKMILKSAAIPGRPDVASKIINILKTEGERELLFSNAELPEIFPPSARTVGILGASDTTASRIALFRFKAEKLFSGMRYADIVNEPDAGFAAANDYISAYYYAYALLLQKEYVKAYDVVLPYIKSGFVNQELLSIAAVAAEKAPAPQAAQIKTLYEESRAILNEIIDLNDVINTGVVYGAGPEEEKSAMMETRPSDFFAAYEKDKAKPVNDLLLTQHEKAAPVFEKNGCVLTAAESYRLLLAKGKDRERNLINLRRLFKESGNSELESYAQIYMWS
jgi:glycosyltransferase involved in cell wall biosynthesis